MNLVGCGTQYPSSPLDIFSIDGRAGENKCPIAHGDVHTLIETSDRHHDPAMLSKAVQYGAAIALHRRVVLHDGQIVLKSRVHEIIQLIYIIAVDEPPVTISIFPPKNLDRGGHLSSGLL